MSDVLSILRESTAEVVRRARHVRVNRAEIAAYAQTLRTASTPGDPDPHLVSSRREERAAFWLTLDAINFGSGWFPTLHKRMGRSGYYTIAQGVSDRFRTEGRWRAGELARLEAADLATALGQDPEHELMALFASSLRDLGVHLQEGYGGSFTALVDSAGGSALALIERLRGWAAFADVSHYDELDVPFLKRAQITAADLDRAQVSAFDDLDRLTMFADNLVAHVLRLDGILEFSPGLVERIEREQLIEHGSREEVEIRASAVQAVELLSAELTGVPPAELDQRLWLRGQDARYKARPRHRCRCTAY